MKLSLEYFLNKKRMSLKAFCDLNGLKTYEELAVYCREKRYICVDKEFYEASVPVKITKTAPAKKKSTKNEQEKERKVQRNPPAKKRGSRKASEKDAVRSPNKTNK